MYIATVERGAGTAARGDALPGASTAARAGRQRRRRALFSPSLVQRPRGFVRETREPVSLASLCERREDRPSSNKRHRFAFRLNPRVSRWWSREEVSSLSPYLATIESCFLESHRTRASSV